MSEQDSSLRLVKEIPEEEYDLLWLQVNIGFVWQTVHGGLEALGRGAAVIRERTEVFENSEYSCYYMAGSDKELQQWKALQHMIKAYQPDSEFVTVFRKRDYRCAYRISAPLQERSVLTLIDRAVRKR